MGRIHHALSTRSQSAKPEFIMRSESPHLRAAILTLAAALGLGCAQLPQAPRLAVSTFDALEVGLEAQGPGVVAVATATARLPLSAHRVSYTLKSQDVARFAIYPRDRDRDVNRANERPSMRDRRTVSFIDPLHRPLYILHPSLVIREYRGEDHELVEAANLRRPSHAPGLLAGN
jgi:hypothetical protein